MGKGRYRKKEENVCWWGQGWQVEKRKSCIFWEYRYASGVIGAF